MKKQLVFILSMMTSPLLAMEKPTLEKYLKDGEADDNRYIRDNIYGVQMIIAKTSEVGFVTLKRDRPGKGIERIEIRLVDDTAPTA